MLSFSFYSIVQEGCLNLSKEGLLPIAVSSAGPAEASDLFPSGVCHLCFHPAKYHICIVKLPRGSGRLHSKPSPHGRPGLGMHRLI